MSNTATITFSHTGVQPPVYVVTSLSDPPWETLEMSVDPEQTASANLIFTQTFDRVAEGSYQYKIRIGDGHWVVDDSKDSATDEQGNRNNVIHVKGATAVTSPASSTEATTSSDQVSGETKSEKPSDPIGSRKDSTVTLNDNTQPPSIPIPFVVVEKVPDKEQPEYGDKEPVSLPVDDVKRAADAEPDLEVVKEEPPSTEPPSPAIPRVVVEKADDKPVYGEDFGDEATVAQKVAHDTRADDASPDKNVITPEDPQNLALEDEQPAPLFRHESFQSDEQPQTAPMKTIDEVSIHSSTDQTSSEDIIHTPSESQDDEETSTEPLFQHEATDVDRHTKLGSGLLLSYEIEPKGEDYNELSNGPLLSHETGLNDDIESADEEAEVDELDAAPLLPHETGFSSYKGSEMTTKSGIESDNVSEPRHYMYGDDEGYGAKTFEPDEAPTFTRGADESDGEESDEGYDDDVPLLPHERGDSAIADHSGSDDEMPFTLHGQPTFSHEADAARQLFGGSGRPPMFRARTNSSTLPHKLPRSDAEDENLLDPSLERFPTSREQILERVATIGLHLPEDQTMGDELHSPITSVLSQACSSVDLAPVKSYTSLASVPEADYSDEDEEDDVASLPSPMVLNIERDPGFTQDPHATPRSDSTTQAETNEEQVGRAPQTHAIEASEAESVGKNDGTKDVIFSKLQEAIATPNKLFNPVTPPLTPEDRISAANKEQAASDPDPHLRQRQVPKNDDSAPLTAVDTKETARAVTPTPTKQMDKHNQTFLQNFPCIIFGSIGRFLTACVGDRKRTG
ncbi:hypothetical protein EK21DRAFT_102895 [Setomelanomma holmii]|uniref:AMP-activated protein kinase glycogen-binding domain-containing protein n=1 Tax=Setomelanomma holmii TaxID=210430 RepID=A0A9P4H464_9PLEO|nr:hypothetical protein EK21DRAFT_102895 [Setomelanomma holmii]